VGQKSGVYHVFDARTGEVKWRRQLGVPLPSGGISGIQWGSSYDGENLYNGAFLARRDGGRYDLTIVPLNMGEANRRVLVAVRDSSHLDCSLAERLRALFGLSPAEAEIAMLIANGHSPADISDERAVSIGTVRLQIKSIALKMECGRQSAIASVVNRLLPLRSPDNGGGSSTDFGN
jgi:DNA-binding CsgD family transcriptional regulator